MRIQNRWLFPVTISATLLFALWLSVQAWPGFAVSAAAPAAPATAPLAATGILTPAWTADFQIANRAGDVDQDSYADLVVAESGAQRGTLHGQQRRARCCAGRYDFRPLHCTTKI